MATTAAARTADEPRPALALGSPGLARVALPLALALGTLVVLLVFLTPPYPSDQVTYLDAARNFPNPPPEGAILHQYARVGLVLPMAVGVQLFGYSQAAYYLVPIAAAVGLVLAVYALGSLLFTRAVAAGAAVLTIGNSHLFTDATAPLPDLLATSLFCWAVVIALALRQGHPAVTRTVRRRRAALVALGVLLAWSYLAREFVVALWPLVGLILVGRVSLRDAILVVVPIGAIGLGELTLNAYQFGDPLARVRAASEHGSAPVSEALARTYQNKPRSWYLTRVLTSIGSAPEGIWLVGAIGAAVAGALVWPRRLAIIVIWAALLYVPLVLVGGILNPDAPMLRLQKVRYWYPIMPALFLGGVAAVWLASRFVARRLGSSEQRAGAIAAVVAVALALVPVGIAQSARAGSLGYRATGATEMEQFRSWLGAHREEVDTIWLELRAGRMAPIFTSGPFGGRVWDGTFRKLELPGGATLPQPGDHVLIYSAHSELCLNCRSSLRTIFGPDVVVPARWSLVFNTPSDNLQVYEVP